MKNNKNVTINHKSSIRDAMINLKKSGIGLVMVVDEKEKVIGTVSDGDIRKQLINNDDIHQSILSCMTHDFIRIYNHPEHEDVLKYFDSKIRVIPILNDQENLIDVIDSNWKPKEMDYMVRSVAPARISLAGGGTDFTEYFMENGGVGLTCTIAKYCHVLLSKRDDNRIFIYSHDFKEKLEIDSLQTMQYDGKLDLIKSGIKLMQPNYGCNIEVACDFSPGSGIGGSASLLVAIIGAFNEYREVKLDRYSIAENAFAAERIDLGVAGGWQDQYSTVFGGFNYIEFNSTSNLVTPLRIELTKLRELEECFILCSTGIPHLGSKIQDQDKKPSHEYSNFGKQLKAISLGMKQSLLKTDNHKFSKFLDETWQIKKNYNPLVTNEFIDSIYNLAIDAGASAGRLLGTGGGGYFLFFAPPRSRYTVIEALESKGLKPENVIFDQMGIQSWKIKE